MERMLFGDNQFFAVNHLSEEKARSQAIKFRDLTAITDIIDYVNDVGIKTFMCTTHDKITEVCDHVRNQPEKYRGFRFYPGMPYAHKYAKAVTDLGVVGALRQYVPGNVFSAFTKGGMALARKDFISMMELLIDAEMKMFRGVSTPVIFIQNVLTDLLLGLGMNDFFIAYHDYIEKKYASEAGFITMNLPKLYETLKDCGIKNPIICTSINRIGFRMSGGLELYEKTLRKGDFTAIAMQVFAAGAIPPKEALEYVCKLDGVHSIVFGASSKAHIDQTKQFIEKFSSSR
jgi:hypothetical protein